MPEPPAPNTTASAGTPDGADAPDGSNPSEPRPLDAPSAPADAAPNPSPPASAGAANAPDPAPTPEPDSESDPASTPPLTDAASPDITTDAGVAPDGETEPAPVDPEPPLPTYPAPGEYGELAPLLEANSEMAVAEANGIIYVIGGYPSSREVQTTVQAYDPASDSWSLVAPLPTPLHHPVVIGHEGKLYSFGGQVSHDQNPDTDRALLYDPELDAWQDLTPMPTPRGAGAAAVVDGVVYVVAGRPPAGNVVEAYDVASDSWQTLPRLPTTFDQRNHLAATAIDGRVFVAGGRYDGGNFSSPMTAALDIFDPGSGEWTAGADLPRPRGGVNGVAAYGCFHVFGGEGSGIGEPNDVFPDHDVYDPRSDTWSSLPPLPVPVHGVTGAVFLEGLIYIPGGGTSSGGSSGSTVFQVYHPTTRCD